MIRSASVARDMPPRGEFVGTVALMPPPYGRMSVRARLAFITVGSGWLWMSLVSIATLVTR